MLNHNTHSLTMLMQLSSQENSEKTCVRLDEARMSVMQERRGRMVSCCQSSHGSGTGKQRPLLFLVVAPPFSICSGPMRNQMAGSIPNAIE